MGLIGAMTGNALGSSLEKLNKKIEESYLLLRQQDPNNSLLDLLDIQAENPFKYKLTEVIYKKYPESEKEKQSHSRFLFRDLNLLEKYLSNLNSELRQPKCTNPLSKFTFSDEKEA
ncbi:MAG: hypothetical protein PVJ67_03250 [Candidatus Pacearchaeota archaeon]|jgi:hypothetical protein